MFVINRCGRVQKGDFGDSIGLREYVIDLTLEIPDVLIQIVNLRCN